MNPCARIRLLLPLVAGGELGPGESARARRHLSACHDCREEEALFSRVIGAARSHGAMEHRLSAEVKRVVALEASTRAASRARIWRLLLPPAIAAAPGRAGILTAAAAVLIALVGLPALLRDRPAPSMPSEAGVTRIQVVAEGGLVRLAWSNGHKDVYTVYKSTDPRDLSGSEIHVVRGNIWTDTDAETSPVVFYRVE
jgi:anti-sigma factor RsiW